MHWGLPENERGPRPFGRPVSRAIAPLRRHATTLRRRCITGAAVTSSSPRFQAVISEIDAANANDPRQDIVAGKPHPRELVYSERMSECLSRLYPEASEALRLAARAQHICRWHIPRDKYPLGREGYNAWRSACRDHHAALASAIMRRHGYAEGEIAQVVKIVRKEALKREDRKSTRLNSSHSQISYAVF